MRTSRHVVALAVTIMVVASGTSGCRFQERMHLKRGNELYTGAEVRGSDRGVQEDPRDRSRQTGTATT